MRPGGDVDLSALRRWWPVAGVAALLALAAVTVPRSALGIGPVEPILQDPPRLTEHPFEPPPTASPVPSAAAAPERAALPDWVVTAVTVLCVAVVVAVVAVLAFVLIRDAARRRLARRRPAPTSDQALSDRAADEVVAAVEAGLVELSDQDADPRRAVIACWVRLEEAAAAAGTPRHIGDTPTDLVARLLGAHHVSGNVLAALAHLYREARYGTHTVDERMRAEALSALHRVRGELRAGAPT
jgi:hypothetical protein